MIIFLFLQNFVLGWDGRGGWDLHKHHHTVPTLLLFFYKQLQMLKSVTF